jgi:hypothetical protein
MITDDEEVTRLTDTQRVAFLCWLARERAPFSVEYQALLDEPIAIVMHEKERRYTAGIGLTFADACDSAATYLGWQGA